MDGAAPERGVPAASAQTCREAWGETPRIEYVTCARAARSSFAKAVTSLSRRQVHPLLTSRESEEPSDASRSDLCARPGRFMNSLNEANDPAREEKVSPVQRIVARDYRRARAWAFIACAFIAIVAVAACWLKLQQERRERALKDQYARSIAHVGRQFELTVRGHSDVVRSITRIACDAAEASASQSEVDLLPSFATQIEKTEEACPEVDLTRSLVKEIETAAPFEPTPALCVAHLMAKAVGIDKVFVDCPEFVSAGGAPILAKELAGDPVVYFPPPRREMENPDGQCSACGKVRIRELIPKSHAMSRFTKRNDNQAFDQVPLNDNQAFDQVLLVKEDGTVLYSRPSSATRVVTFPRSELREPGVSRSASLSLGTGKYEAFLQPVNLSFMFLDAASPRANGHSAVATQSGMLVLCGLVSKARFDRERDQVLPTTFLLAITAIGFAVLLLPLAKLWLVGSRSRFRRYDAAFLVTSAAIAALLATLFLLTQLARIGLRHGLDEQMRQVAAGFSTHLRNAMKGGTTALTRFKATLAEGLLGPDGAVREEKAKEVLGAECRSWAYEQGGAPACEATRYPAERLGIASPSERDGFSLAFWANGDGNQQIKISPEPHATNPVNVAERPYFRRALRNDVGCLDGPAPGCTSAERAGAQIVPSWTSGETVLFIAGPTYAGDATKPMGVATVQWKIRSLVSPLLPFGFQSALVDAKGLVMLHSDNEQHQGQVIFDNMEDAAPLRAAMASGTSQPFNTSYLGVASRMYVEHLPGPNWYVVVIARRDLVEAPTANAAIIAGVGYTVVGGLIAFVAGGILLVRLFRSSGGAPNTPRHRFTLRPNAANTAEYSRAAIRLIVWTAATCLLALVLTPYVPTTPLLLLVAFGASRCVASLPGFSQWRRHADTAEQELDAQKPPKKKTLWTCFPAAYTLCCLGLVGIFVVSPVTALFAGAYDHSVENQVRAAQEYYGKSLEYRVECLNEKWKGADCPRQVVPENVTVEDGKEFAREEAIWAQRSLGACTWWSPIRCFGDRLPALAAGGLTEFSRLDRSGGPPSTVEKGQERRWYRTWSDLKLVPPGHSNSAVLATPLPRLLDAWKLDSVRAEGLQLALLVLVCAVLPLGALAIGYFSIRRMLFLDLSARLTCPLDPTQWANPPGQKVLVVRAPAWLARYLEGAEDGRNEYENVTHDREPEAVDASAKILVDLGPLLADPRQPARIAHLAASPATVVAISHDDPLSHAPAALREQWASALAVFEVRDGRPREDPRLLKRTLSARPFAQLWSDSSDDEQRVLAQLAFDGNASPHPTNTKVLEQLCVRGLVHPETLTIVGDDFADFIRANANIEAWQESEGRTAWNMIRVPLATSIAALLVILGNNNLELAATGALIPTIAAALPAVLSILSPSSNAS